MDFWSLFGLVKKARYDEERRENLWLREELIRVNNLLNTTWVDKAGLQLKINLLEQQVKELRAEARLLRIGIPVPAPAAESAGAGWTIAPDTHPRGGITVPGAEDLNWPPIDTSDIDPRFAEAHFQNDLFPAAKCRCGDRLASQCDEEWGPNCDLGNNPACVRHRQA